MYCDGGVMYCDGGVVYCDGIAVYCDGGVVYCDGGVVYFSLSQQHTTSTGTFGFLGDMETDRPDTSA